ncbi:hypothetical protein HA050_20650 [Iodobacter sp. HSC-16F04]|uniref:SGNH hydrolase-type esterase domain-containing protein n=1 Tax=Iodobacter violaceini TaxID=3044271 RepID=A0ABX0L0Y2_9NEIS|nr:GDSL-type esterase/lipase family protein [Iodobacter violacea]NHQ88513.1 hypothetical protein [Iodobacter violacea]
MKKVFYLNFIFVLSTISLYACGGGAGEDIKPASIKEPQAVTESSQPLRDELLALAKQYPAIQGGIFFYGSSTFTRWNASLNKDFPGFSVVPRGFGGSTFYDALLYLDEFVLNFKPKIIIVYEGDNDIYFGVTPQGVLANAKLFLQRVKVKSPATKVVFLSLKPSIQRKSKLTLQVETNLLIKNLCDSNDCHYVDVTSPMLDKTGNVIASYYDGTDGLHFNQSGYILWKNIIDKFLN